MNARVPWAALPAPAVEELTAALPDRPPTGWCAAETRARHMARGAAV